MKLRLLGFWINYLSAQKNSVSNGDEADLAV